MQQGRNSKTVRDLRILSSQYRASVKPQVGLEIKIRFIYKREKKTVFYSKDDFNIETLALVHLITVIQQLLMARTDGWASLTPEDGSVQLQIIQQAATLAATKTKKTVT